MPDVLWKQKKVNNNKKKKENGGNLYSFKGLVNKSNSEIDSLVRCILLVLYNLTIFPTALIL